MKTLDADVTDLNPEISLTNHVISGQITFKQELPIRNPRSENKTRKYPENVPVSVILDTDHIDEILYFIMDETKKLELIKFLIKTIDKEKKCILLELLGKDLSETLSTVV